MFPCKCPRCEKTWRSGNVQEGEFFLTRFRYLRYDGTFRLLCAACLSGLPEERRRIQARRPWMISALVLFSLLSLTPVMWVTMTECRAITLASNRYGHIKDYDKRMEAMHGDMDVTRAGSDQWYDEAILFAAANGVVALWILVKGI